ncbi:glutamate--tRNA ligase [Buchnera aphidicola]|uniref:glutamate--tRNA ligase n=1 Tax=Buchnera aphidicola TaxID=9 RepID=UPI0030EB17F2
MFVITRFAPSPTGNLHLGSLRTALYSWLYSIKKNGNFILRIEDSDFKRSSFKFVKNILYDLKWLGINWHQDPIFQSDRLIRYKKIVKKMIKLNLAYKCYCSPERLKKLKKHQILLKEKPKYDRKCRDLKQNISNNNIKKKYVVRFKNPNYGNISFYDEVRGKIIFKNSELDDLILQRSNGFPTYNLCVVVDDMDSKITHVIRGEDHINNTPRQINILKSLGAKIPKYVHLSMILNKEKKKLSKRNNLNDISYYRKQGYFPEAILNYVVRLGWSYKNQEIFTINEVKKLFKLSDINISPSIFDQKKILWFNKYYMNLLSTKKIKKYLKIFLLKKNIKIIKKPNLKKFIKFFSMHCNTLKDLYKYYLYFLNSKINLKKFNFVFTIRSFNILKILYQKLKFLKIWKIQKISKILKNLVIHLKINFSDIGILLRISLFGKISSPDINKILYLYGKKQTLLKIKNTLKNILKNFKKLSKKIV